MNRSEDRAAQGRYWLMALALTLSPCGAEARDERSQVTGHPIDSLAVVDELWLKVRDTVPAEQQDARVKKLVTTRLPSDSDLSYAYRWYWVIDAHQSLKSALEAYEIYKPAGMEASHRWLYVMGDSPEAYAIDLGTAVAGDEPILSGRLIVDGALKQSAQQQWSCKLRKVRTLSVNIYASDGKLVHSEIEPRQWEDVVTGSPPEVLLHFACS